MAAKVISFLLLLLSATTADAVVRPAATHGNVSARVHGGSPRGLLRGLLSALFPSSADRAAPPQFRAKHHCGQLTPALCQCTTAAKTKGNCKAPTETCAENFNRNDLSFERWNTIFKADGNWMVDTGPGWSCTGANDKKCYQATAGPYCQMEILPNGTLKATYKPNTAAHKFYAFACGLGSCAADKLVHFKGMYEWTR
mmetsp:Transcript_35475/g.99640  ORF Transcript_35475/g.99640 Transcript_35475/m.99640 type:complete len:198 (+) Transcript_35475:77-670(+)